MLSCKLRKGEGLRVMYKTLQSLMYTRLKAMCGWVCSEVVLEEFGSCSENTPSFRTSTGFFRRRSEGMDTSLFILYC